MAHHLLEDTLRGIGFHRLAALEELHGGDLHLVAALLIEAGGRGNQRLDLARLRLEILGLCFLAEKLGQPVAIHHHSDRDILDRIAVAHSRDRLRIHFETRNLFAA